MDQPYIYLSGDELETPDYCTNICLPDIDYVCGFRGILFGTEAQLLTYHCTSKTLENGPSKGPKKEGAEVL